MKFDRTLKTKSRMADGCHLKNLKCHNSRSVQDTDMMVGSAVGFWGSADPMVKNFDLKKIARWRLEIILDIQK